MCAGFGCRCVSVFPVVEGVPKKVIVARGTRTASGVRQRGCTHGTIKRNGRPKIIHHTLRQRGGK